LSYELLQSTDNNPEEEKEQKQMKQEQCHKVSNEVLKPKKSYFCQLGSSKLIVLFKAAKTR